MCVCVCVCVTVQLFLIVRNVKGYVIRLFIDPALISTSTCVLLGVSLTSFCPEAEVNHFTASRSTALMHLTPPEGADAWLWNNLSAHCQNISAFLSSFYFFQVRSPFSSVCHFLDFFKLSFLRDCLPLFAPVTHSASLSLFSSPLAPQSFNLNPRSGHIGPSQQQKATAHL